MVFLAGSDALFWLQFPVGGLAVLVGFVLYGVATLQVKVLPRWCGIAFIIAVPVSVALGGAFGSPSVDYVWLGLVWLALGYVLWTRRGTTEQQPSRVRYKQPLAGNFCADYLFFVQTGIFVQGRPDH